MITTLHHICINVRSIPHAVHFYLALGMPVIPLDATRAFVCAPNSGILLVQVPITHPPQSQVHDLGWRHLCIQVPNMPQALAICKQYGVTPLSDPVDLQTGHLYVYGKDIDNTLIEVEEVPYAPIHYPSWMGHIAGVTPDIEQLATFYAQFIGGEIVDPGVIGPNPAYDRVVGFSHTRLRPTWIKRLNLTIELWQFVHPPSPTRHHQSHEQLGYHSIALISADLVSDVRKCLALGGGIQHTPSSTHVIMTDCDGNQIDVYAPADPLICAVGASSNPTLLTQNAAHWRPRSI